MPHTIPAPPDVHRARSDLHSKSGRAYTKQRCEHSVQKGGQCTNNAVPGSRFCTFHGGNLPNVARAATARAQKDWLRLQAQKHLLKYHGIEFSEEPLEGILGEVKTSALMVKAYEELIAGMTPADPMFFSLIDLYNSERDRHVKFAKTAIDGDVLERQAKISEGLAGITMTLLVSVLLDPELGLDSRVAERARLLYAQRANELLGQPVITIPAKAVKGLPQAPRPPVPPIELERPT